MLIACMSFNQTGSGIYELIRYATINSFGFNELLNYFKNTHTWKSISVMVDVSWNIDFDASGWVLKTTHTPQAMYVQSKRRVKENTGDLPKIFSCGFLEYEVTN